MSYVRSAFFVVLGLVTGAVVELSIVRAVRDEKAGPPTLSVHHERTSTVRSRCDECPQPGDVIKASVRGPSSMVRGVSVYREEGFVRSCFGCDDLSMTADLLGRYLVVGFQMSRAASCVLPCGSYDGDVVALQRCGAVLVTSEVIIR
jgi:hypothetical protein